MRVSTSQLFDVGTANIVRNQSALFKTQNQISTGRRVLTPADDPIASAQALLTTQAKEVNAQYAENQGVARSQLGLVESHLQSLGDLIQNVRERTVQLGNPTLSERERASIAGELRERFSELVGIANSQNGQGQYLFSGFQGNTVPFSVKSPPGSAPFSAGTPVTPLAQLNPYVIYNGDDGERLLQVDSSRQMSISASGADVFMRIKQGNGTFSTSAAAGNSGTGIVDQGTVVNLSNWNSAVTQPQDYRIDFQVDSSGATPVVKYNLIDSATGNSLYTNAAPGLVTNPLSEWKVYTPGQAISFSGLNAAVVPGGDLGIQVLMSGTPANGDSFSVKASQNQSIFDTLQNLIAATNVPVTSPAAGNTILASRVGEGLANLDQALDNVLRVRSVVGSHLAEIDSLSSANADKGLQYDQRLSELQDLDYAVAISNLNKQQLQLEAAQKSFVQISGLSLFSIL